MYKPKVPGWWGSRPQFQMASWSRPRRSLFTRGGAPSRGRGRGIETVNPDGTDDVTDGKFSLKKGTGAYKGHTFKRTFDGTYADGVYTFEYDAVYR